jgi:FKBP-type peptidyl-prolyl cis-trans isomerase
MLVFLAYENLLRSGWDEGVPQLSVGEKAVLVCSPDYA